MAARSDDAFLLIVGGPIISSGAPKVVARWFAGTGRGFAMGIYMTGPFIGGMITLTMSHSVFLPWLGGDWRELRRLDHSLGHTEFLLHEVDR